MDVTIEDQPLSVDTRKAIALFAHLVVEGSVSRGRAAALLWSEASEERARASLRRTLSSLVKGLGGRAVAADRDRIVLLDEDVWSDVDALVNPADEPDDVLALRRGDFLEDLDVRGAKEFEGWRRETARALDERWLGLVDDGLRTALDEDRDDRAEALAVRRLAVEPGHERTHALLIWLAARRGDRDLVASRYRDCVAALHTHLGMAPMARTTQLHEDALAELAAAEAWTGPATGDLDPLPAEDHADHVRAVLAVAEVPIPAAVLSAASGVPASTLVKVVDDLAADGDVVIEERGILVPAATRDELLGSLDPVRRHALHRRLADALEGTPRFAALRARHLDAAGDPKAAAAAFEDAARASLREGRWEEARHQLGEAVAAGHPESGRLLAERADLDARRGRHEEARDGLMAALVSTESERERAELELRLGRLQLRRQQWAAAMVHLRAATALGRHVEAELALARWRLGDRELALAQAHAALDEALAEGDVIDVIALRNVLGLLHRRAEQPDVAAEHLEAGLALAGADDPQRAALLNNLGLVRCDEERWDEARAFLDEARRLAQDIGDLHREAAILSNQADIERAVGDLETAKALVKESATRFALVSTGPLPAPELWSTRDW